MSVSQPLDFPAPAVSADAAPLPVAASDELAERDLILATSLGHFVCHLAETLYGAVIVAVMAEFGLDERTAASLATAGFLLLGLGALPAGLWSDAWGELRVFRWYFGLTAGAALLVAAAPTAWFLFLALALLGLATSIYHPVGLALLALGVRSRGRAMGLNGVAGSVGVALGPALGTCLRAPGWWRFAYVVVAVISLLAGLYFYRVTRGRRPVAAHPHHAPGAALDAPAPWSATASLLLLYAAMVLGGLNYRCLVTALPTFLSGEHATGVELGRGAALVFVTLIVGGLGQLLGGRLADQRGASAAYPLFILALVPLAALMGLFGPGTAAFLLSLPLAVALFGQQPAENAVLAEQTARGRRGLSYGTKFILTFGVGALGAPLVGLVWEKFGGLAHVFYFIAGTAAVMAVLAGAALALGRRARPGVT